MTQQIADRYRNVKGAQRHSIERLKRWEALEYGMFIHFGMSTYDGYELSMGDKPATLYNPTELDVEQWVRTAKDAGMRYVVLTTKHTAGFCLWPSKHTEYHVGNSSNTTDVVGEFVNACSKHGLKPGFYYCSWDNHNRFGSMTPNTCREPYTTEEYRQFQRAQVEELLTQYGQIEEVWIDIPIMLDQDGRYKQYQQIAELQPDAVIMLNTGFGDGTDLKLNYAWPSDLVAIERNLPSSAWGYNPWHEVKLTGRITHGPDPERERGFADDEPEHYYVPAEVCDPIGYHWFHEDDDLPRSTAELLGMRLIARERKANFLLNVPPDRRGVIPDRHVEALMKLREQVERVG